MFLGAHQSRTQQALELLNSLRTPGSENLYDQDWESDASKIADLVSSEVTAERNRCAGILERALDTKSIPDPAFAWLSDALAEIKAGAE